MEFERNIEKPSVTSLCNNSVTCDAAEKPGVTTEEMEPRSWKIAAMRNDEMREQWSELKEGTLQIFYFLLKTGTYRGRQYMEKYCKKALLMYFLDSRNN